MPTDAISHRYADALVQWATESNRLDDVMAQLTTVNTVFDELGDGLYDVLSNPSLDASQKFDLLNAALTGADEAVKNLLFLLIEHQRIRLFPAVVADVQAMVDDKQGRVRGTLTTAAPVDPAVLAKVTDAMKARYGYTEVLLETVVDSRILGGAALQFGDRRIDGTFLSQLQQMTQPTAVS